MEIEILHNYRETGGFDIELTNGNIIKLMVIRHNKNNNLIACQIQGVGRIVLYEGVETNTHLNDTEEQLIERLLEIIDK